MKLTELLELDEWEVGVGVGADYLVLLFPSGSERFLHGSSCTLRTELWFGLIQCCCHSAIVTGLDGWTTQLPFAPVLQGSSIFHQSPRDYLRLRIQIKGLAVSGTGIMCRNPPGGRDTGRLPAYIEQPFPLTFLVCG